MDLPGNMPKSSLTQDLEVSSYGSSQGLDGSFYNLGVLLLGLHNESPSIWGLYGAHDFRSPHVGVSQN